MQPGPFTKPLLRRITCGGPRDDELKGALKVCFCGQAGGLDASLNCVFPCLPGYSSRGPASETSLCMCPEPLVPQPDNQSWIKHVAKSYSKIIIRGFRIGMSKILARSIM